MNIEDFKVHKLWNWSEIDKKYVPYKINYMPSEEECDELGLSLILHCTIELANGDRYEGYCSPQDLSGLDYVQPVIFLKNISMNIYKEWDQLKTVFNIEKSIFPIKVNCSLNQKEKPISFSITQNKDLIEN